MAVRRNRSVDFVEPCPLSIRDNLWPYTSRRVEYVEEIEESFQLGFRSVPWPKHQDLIQGMLKKYDPLSMWFGSFDEQVFAETTQQWGNQCFSVSINYDKEDFDFMKQKWIRWQTGLVMESKKYSEFRSRFDNDHTAIEQYLLHNESTTFGYELPLSRKAKADLEINLRDLFNKEKFAIILSMLEVNNTEEDWKFYEEYCRVSG